MRSVLRSYDGETTIYDFWPPGSTILPVSANLSEIAFDDRHCRVIQRVGSSMKPLPCVWKGVGGHRRRFVLIFRNQLLQTINTEHRSVGITNLNASLRGQNKQIACRERQPYFFFSLTSPEILVEFASRSMFETMWLRLRNRDRARVPHWQNKSHDFAR